MSEEERTATKGAPGLSHERHSQTSFLTLQWVLLRPSGGGGADRRERRDSRALGIREGRDLVGRSGEMASPLWGVWGGAAGTQGTLGPEGDMGSPLPFLQVSPPFALERGTEG